MKDVRIPQVSEPEVTLDAPIVQTCLVMVRWAAGVWDLCSAVFCCGVVLCLFGPACLLGLTCFDGAACLLGCFDGAIGVFGPVGAGVASR